ncbi:MAG: hypothetical protein O3A51_12930 [Verrucomicrobia bacterium]|nr:hypothetical protein [Verrucomicrobiota bacterium]
MNTRAISVAAAAGLCLCRLSAFASPFSLTETFSAPPLTPGTDPGFFEDGFLSGDNGWVIIEDAAVNFGQRGDVSVFGGTFDQFAQLRARAPNPDAFMVRQFFPSSQELLSGTIRFDIADVAISGFSETGLQLILLGNSGASTALSLDLADVTAASDNLNRFEVQTTGGGTVIADPLTLTLSGDPLLWHDSAGGDGNYVSFNLDFNTVTDLATVTLTTTDSGGAFSSTAPFNVAMTDIAGGVDQISLRLFSPLNGNSVGSLAWLDNYTISGDLVSGPPRTPLEVDLRTAVEMTWPTSVGFDYVPQYTEDLVASNSWISLGPVIVGTGSAGSAFDTTQNADLRAYRVLEQQQ